MPENRLDGPLDSRKEAQQQGRVAPAEIRRDQTLALRQAIEAGDIRPYYQPIVEWRDGGVIGFEVLARWLSASGDAISPDDFIPLAESSGLLKMLTDSLLRSACRDAGHWPADLTLSFNLAPSQFLDENLAEMIAAPAQRYDVPLSRLLIEITEGVLQGSAEKATATTQELRELGIRLAMDDFGIGDSNIRRLGLVDFDMIKIDRCVVRSITPEVRTQKGLIAAIAVGDSLGLQVVAEGIEEEWQAATLATLGCSTMQGWLTGRPMPAEDVSSFLSRRDQPRQSHQPCAATPPSWLAAGRHELQNQLPELLVGIQ